MQLFLGALLLAVVTSIRCPDGQYTDANNLCQPCMLNCAVCSGPDFCSACSANTYLVSNTFSMTCQPCAVVLAGCSVCLTNMACHTCSDGYFLNQGGCSFCSVGVPNCANCTSDGKSCNICQYPYQLINGTCVSATVNNIVSGATTITNNNTSSVILSNGTQVPAILDAYGCNQLQVYWNGKCLKSIVQCQVYQDSGLCAVCNAGYLVTIFGDCAPNTTVLRCENGYWLNATSDKCQMVSVSCDWFYPNNGSCYNCSANYRMSPLGTCLPALTCTSRQFFSEGLCVPVPLACLSFLSDGTCTKCADGNTLKNGLCTLSITTVTFNDCL